MTASFDAFAGIQPGTMSGEESHSDAMDKARPPRLALAGTRKGTGRHQDRCLRLYFLGVLPIRRFHEDNVEFQLACTCVASSRGTAARDFKPNSGRNIFTRRTTNS